MAEGYKCSCGAVLKPPPGARFFICPQCKTRHEIPQIAPEEQPPENLTACSQCGTVIPAGSRKCPKCGASPNKKKKESKDKPALGSIIKLALLGIVGIGLIVAAVVGMTRDRGEERETREVEPSGPLYDVVTMPRQMDRRATLIGAQNAIQAFEALEGRLPRDLGELDAAGLTPPPPPDGMKYQYNPDTGDIALVEAENDGG